MKHLNLVEFRIGHNHIERLENDLFSAELGISVKIFTCSENNLLELPLSLKDISPECLLEVGRHPVMMIMIKTNHHDTLIL